MYMVGCDNDESTMMKLEKILRNIDPNGEHRFYTDAHSLINDLDKPVEMAFIDAEMSEMDGITLAQRIMARYPLCNIVFLADGTEYMQAAFGIHASGYIMKPLTKAKIQDEILHRRYITPDYSDRPVKVQCFGSFKVFVGGKPVVFKRQKTIMTLAYLIDRRGALCDTDTLIGNIEPECVSDENTKSKIRVYIGDMVVSFARLRINDIILKSSGTYGVDTSLLDCDYYRYLESDPEAISKYSGEYMTGYDFADVTRDILRRKRFNNL